MERFVAGGKIRRTASAALGPSGAAIISIARGWRCDSTQEKSALSSPSDNSRFSIGLIVLEVSEAPPGPAMPEAFAMLKKSLLLVATPTSAFNRSRVRSASVSRASCSGRSSRGVARLGGSAAGAIAIAKLNCEDLKSAFTNGLETWIDRPRTAKDHSLTRGTDSIQNRRCPPENRAAMAHHGIL